MRAASDIPGQEIARLGELGTMPEIKPAVLEDTLLLRRQDLGVDEIPPGDLEEVLRLVDQNGRFVQFS
jgi:hypothetical protein